MRAAYVLSPLMYRAPYVLSRLVPGGLYTEPLMCRAAYVLSRLCTEPLMCGPLMY